MADSTAKTDAFSALMEKIPFGVSCAVALVSIFNWRLGAAVGKHYGAGMFTADFVAATVFYAGFLLFYAPIIHLLAEKNAPGAKNLVAQINLATIALAGLLPLGILARLVSSRAMLFTADFALRILFIWAVSSGIKKVYAVGRLKSFALIAAPFAAVFFLAATASAAAILWLWRILS